MTEVTHIMPASMDVDSGQGCLEVLTADLWQQVLSFLPPESYGAARLVCKTFRGCLDANSFEFRPKSWPAAERVLLAIGKPTALTFDSALARLTDEGLAALQRCSSRLDKAEKITLHMVTANDLTPLLTSMEAVQTLCLRKWFTMSQSTFTFPALQHVVHISLDGFCVLFEDFPVYQMLQQLNLCSCSIMSGKLAALAAVTTLQRLSLVDCHLFQKDSESFLGNDEALTDLPVTDLCLHNSISAQVPAGVRHLTRLTSLDLSNNSLSELPDWIGDLTSLEELSLSNNHLGALPEAAFGKLTGLKKLDLRRSGRMMQLPPVLKSLPKLAELYYDGSNKPVTRSGLFLMEYCGLL